MLKLSNVLCPVDFSEFSAKAYDYAFSLARHYNAKLFVQHVTEPALALYRSYISPQTIEDVYSRQTAYVRERRVNEQTPGRKYQG
ncbi:MAG TPA: universal stress protein [Bryobacteraceae bacterium]|nr:universal stress protein [Bryobacteraceae bacterium]